MVWIAGLPHVFSLLLCAFVASPHRKNMVAIVWAPVVELEKPV